MKLMNFTGVVGFGLGALLLAYGCSTQQDGDSNGNGNGNGNSGSGNAGTPGSNAGTGSGFSVGTGANGGGVDEDAGIDDLRDASCAGWTAEPEGLPVVLQLVVDVSGSMDEEAPGNDNETKWEVTQPALATAIETFPPSTSVGMLFYPNRDTDDTDQQPQDVSACVNTDALIPIAQLGATGSAQRQAIADGLTDASPDGYTPTHDAYRYALNNGLLASTASGQRYMLLITDGAPTLALECVREGGGQGGGGVSVVETDPIVAEIAAANAQGIRTFVIGSPGSEVGDDGEDMRPWLSRAAIEGGTAAAGCAENGPNFCHFDMTQAPDFAEALTAALQAITGAVVSCSYELPQPQSGQVLDLTKINAFYTPAGGGEPEIIGRVAEGAPCTQGWQLVNNRVELCTETCNLVQSDQAGRFELLFGCASMMGPAE